MNFQDGGIMQTKSEFLKKAYSNYQILAALPAICVIIDYALTFFLAGDTSMITSWEASPFVRFAVIHNVMAAYLLGIVLFYYVAAYAVLRVLHNTVYYKFGVLLIVLLSVTHVLGGMSWFFRTATYSNGIFILSLLSIVIAFIAFGFSLLHEKTPA